MTKGVKVSLAVVGGAAVLGVMCCLAVAVFGLVVDDGAPRVGVEAQRAGFSFAPPASFQKRAEDRWRREQRDGSELLWVEVQRLPAVEGLDDAEQKVATLWRRLMAGKSTGALVQRRFVSNGARAWFTRARLTDARNEPSWVSLYAVEADDHLEPFLVTQGCDTDELGAAMIVEYSFPKTHAFVEELIAAVRGSPTGVPLVSDDEVVGHFVFGDTNTAQWINTVTGVTSMTAVARGVDFTFNDDGTYTYSFTGGSGQVGAIKFATDKDEGEWKVEHDVLVLIGKKWQRKLLIVGAPTGPDGQRLLLLQSEPTWSLAPGADTDVYVRR